MLHANASGHKTTHLAFLWLPQDSSTVVLRVFSNMKYSTSVLKHDGLQICK